MNFETIIVLAVLVETLYSNLRMIWDKDKFNINNVLVLILAIIVAVLTKVDLFPVVGLPIDIPFVGPILTGILISRGANVVFDLTKKLNNIKETPVNVIPVVETKKDEVIEEVETKNDTGVEENNEEKKIIIKNNNNI